MQVDIITPTQAAAMISSGSTLVTVGMTLVGASESILRALEGSFLQTGRPNNLTLVHASGQSDRDQGMQRFAHEGFVTRIVGSHWGLQPRWMEMISSNKVEAFCIPQGQATHLLQAMSAGQPGYLSKVGLHTFIDPRLEGGRMNQRTQKLDPLVEFEEFRGEEYLFYKQVPLDFCIIRGTYADEMGNINCSEEAILLEMLPAVLATKRFGGKVIAQVKQVVKTGTLHPKSVVVPGPFVDAVVVCPNPQEEHLQTHSYYYDPSLCGDIRIPLNGVEPFPLNIRKIIGRRAVQEIAPGNVINLGTGIPADVVGPISVEEGIADDFVITVESGIYGGLTLGGIDFGVARNMFAMITHHDQFDYYDGTGVDVTFMGAGEMDQHGNVNATKMGDRCTGAGGFIDITQNAKHVVFCSSFTARGLEIDINSSRGIEIKQEGSTKKLVSEVQQISYASQVALGRNQKMHYVTERAVFELLPEGVTLTEIAPGMDLKRDILANMEFTPRISSNLKTMDLRIYNQGPMGLGEVIRDQKHCV